MAFFGLRWIPKNEREISASEAGPSELASIVKSIRERGADISKTQKAQLEAEYATAYQEYTQAEAQRQQWEAYISQIMQPLQQYTGIVQTAAQYWMAQDPAYYTFLQANQIPPPARQAIEPYVSYLQATEQVSTLEKKLWSMSYHMESSKKAEELWEFESDSAGRAQKKLQEEEKETKARRREIQRLNESKMQELKRQHHGTARREEEQANSLKNDPIAEAILGALPGAAPPSEKTLAVIHDSEQNDGSSSRRKSNSPTTPDGLAPPGAAGDSEAANLLSTIFGGGGGDARRRKSADVDGGGKESSSKSSRRKSAAITREEAEGFF